MPQQRGVPCHWAGIPHSHSRLDCCTGSGTRYKGSEPRLCCGHAAARMRRVSAARVGCFQLSGVCWGAYLPHHIHPRDTFSGQFSRDGRGGHRGWCILRVHWCRYCGCAWGSVSGRGTDGSSSCWGCRPWLHDCGTRLSSMCSGSAGGGLRILGFADLLSQALQVLSLNGFELGPVFGADRARDACLFFQETTVLLKMRRDVLSGQALDIHYLHRVYRGKWSGATRAYRPVDERGYWAAPAELCEVLQFEGQSSPLRQGISCVTLVSTRAGFSSGIPVPL